VSSLRFSHGWGDGCRWGRRTRAAALPTRISSSSSQRNHEFRVATRRYIVALEGTGLPTSIARRYSSLWVRRIPVNGWRSCTAQKANQQCRSRW